MYHTNVEYNTTHVHVIHMCMSVCNVNFGIISSTHVPHICIIIHHTCVYYTRVYVCSQCRIWHYFEHQCTTHTYNHTPHMCILYTCVCMYASNLLLFRAPIYNFQYKQPCTYIHMCVVHTYCGFHIHKYGVAAISRLLEIIGLFCRIYSLL